MISCNCYNFTQMKLKVALIQLDAQNDKARNLEKVAHFCNEAAAGGAEFILLPETFNLRRSEEPKNESEYINSGETITLLRGIAQSRNVHILAGSICERPEPEDLTDDQDEDHVFNTSVLITPEGQIKARYRKIHLFESTLSDANISESAIYLSGSDTVLTDVNSIPLGLSICYDLRFPELYRQYSFEGALMYSVPSSFTSPTGRVHWEVLLRARAIENLAYVLAPNQTGLGANGVSTFGNSMVIDPWGNVIARASESLEEVIYAELDFEKLREYRKAFPALSHVRL